MPFETCPTLLSRSHSGLLKPRRAAGGCVKRGASLTSDTRSSTGACVRPLLFKEVEVEARNRVRAVRRDPDAVLDEEVRESRPVN